MKWKKAIAIVVAVAVAGGAIYGGIYAYNAYQSKNLVAEVRPVSNINWGYWGDQETSYGMVTNDSSQEIYLENESKVEEVYVQQGDEVKEGDPLIKYDTSEIEIEIERKKLDISNIQNNIAKAEHTLAVLKQTQPVDKTRPEIDISPFRPSDTEETGSSLPEKDKKDSRIYNYVTEDSVPYNVKTADGSAENPYIFYVNKDAYAYGSFFNSIRPTGDGSDGKHVVFIVCKKDKNGKMVMKEIETEQDSETEETTEESGVEIESGILKDESEEKKSSSSKQKVPVADESVNPNTKAYDGNNIPVAYDDYRMWYIFTGEEVEESSDFDDLLDSIVDEQEWEEPEGYSKEELAEAIEEKEQELKKLDIQLRSEELHLESLQNTASDGMVYAKIDGVVKSVSDIDSGADGDDFNGDGAFMVVTGQEGLYVSGTISELLLDEIKPGMVVTANSWETGNTFQATITEIFDYPVSGNSWGDGNPNVSYYRYTAYIEDSSALKNGEYVDLSIQTGSSEGGGLYIEKAYVREENGKPYVMIADENNRLKKQYVVTGKTVYGSAIQIKSGLSETDLIAFPYGKTAVEGTLVSEEEATIYY